MNEKRPYSLLLKSTLFILVMVLPLNILSVVHSRMSYYREIRNAGNTITYSLSSCMELLDYRLRNANNLLYNLPRTNTYCINLFMQDESWHYTMARNQFFLEFRESLAVSNSADQMFFYMCKKDDFICISPEEMPDSTVTDFMEECIKDYDTSRSRWFLCAPDGTPSLMRIVYDNVYDVFYGARISLKDSIRQVTDTSTYESMKICFNENEAKSDSNTLVYSAASGRSDISIYAAISKSDFSSNMDFWTRTILYVFLFYLFLVPLMIYMFMRHVGKPLRILNRAHKELSEGNESYRITAKPISSEFSEAFHSFNSMSETLQQLRLENINKELANKQLQIDYLQLQIRPHFLLNTFNLLYTLIQNRQSAPAQSLILYLSNYFRYIFRSGKELVLFSKELQLIEEYMAISQIYYPDAFTVSYQLDPVISLMRTPPLLLHSFMENIIHHALIPGQVIHIILYGEYDDGYVTFQISDDGRGMSDEDIEAINCLTDSTADTGKHVGIRNSLKRLKYYYGENASLSVESQLNAGTTFTIIIPYNLEGEEDEFTIS